MKKRALLAATGLSGLLIACGGGSGGSSDAAKTALNTVDEVPQETLANEPHSVGVTLYDDSGALLTKSGEISVVSDPYNLFAEKTFGFSAGSAVLSATRQLSDQDNDGFPDQFAEITLLVSGVDGFLSSGSKVLLDRFGRTDVELTLLPLEGVDGVTTVEKNIEAGVSELVNVDVADTDSELVQQISLSGVIAVKTVSGNSLDDGDDVEGAVYLSDSIKAYNAQGTPLPADSLKVSVAAIRPDKLSLTGAISLSGVVSVSNPAALEGNSALGNVPKGAKKIRLNSLGTTQVVATSNGEKVTNLSPSTPALIEVEILPGALNPTTLQPIAVGERIPLWSRDDTRDTWQYEGLYPVQAGTSGRLIVRAPITHFSYFSLGFAEVADGCSGTLYIRDDAGKPFSGEGTIRLESERFSLEDVYRGSQDGVISFTELPAVPATISFDSDSNDSIAFVPENTTLQFAAGGGVSAGLAHNVDLCASQGATLTARMNSDTPVVVLGYEPYYRAGDSVYLRSMREGDSPADAEKPRSQLRIPVKVINPPANDVVLHYSFETGAGFAEAGVDFIDSLGSSLTLSAGQRSGEIILKSVPDTDIENRYKPLRMTILKPSNAALSRGSSSVTLHSALYDDDQPAVSAVNVPAMVSEGDPLTIGVALDRSPASPVALAYRIVGREAAAYAPTDLATGDGASYRYDRVSRKVGLYGTVYVPAGQTTATVSIPVAMDGEAEGVETWDVEVLSVAGAYVPDEAQRKQTFYVNDRDNIETPATEFVVREVVLNGDFVANNVLREGEILAITVQMNGVASEDRTFALSLGGAPSAQHRDTWLYSAGNEPLQLIHGSSADIVIPAGQNSAHVTMLSHRDFGVYGDGASALVTVTPPADMGASVSRRYVLKDIDDTHVDWFISSAEDTRTEGLDAAFDIELSYFSNDPTARLDLSAFRIESDHEFPAQNESDYLLSAMGPFSFSGEEGRQSVEISIVDDQVSETSEIIDIYVNGAAESERRGAGRVHLSPSAESNLRLFILDNDKAVLSNLDKFYRLETNSRFSGEIGVQVTTAKAFPQAVDVLLSLVDADDTGIALAETRLRLEAGAKSASLPITFDDISPSALGIESDGGTTIKKLRVNVKLAETSKQALAQSKVEWGIAKADALITLEFVYSPDKSGPPATGGAGSGQ